MGRRALISLALLLLALPPVLPVGAQEAAVATWRVGDRWDYNLTVVSPESFHTGSLTVKVTGDGTVRLHNESVRAYTLSISRRERWEGFNITSTITRLVDRATLCTLFSNTTQTMTLGGLESRWTTTEYYSPSDGRYQFPLGAGLNWTASYGVNRTTLTSNSRKTEDIDLSRALTCEVREGLSVPYGRHMALRVRCTLDDTGNYSRYWYSESVRGDLKVEDYDRVTRALTTLALTRYSRAAEAAPILGPDTEKALVLATAALVFLCILIVAMFIRARPPKPPPPVTQEEQGPPAFTFESSRDGYSMKVNTVELACPACRKRFKVMATARTVRCPHCGHEGKRG